ncbi:hypothetical protein MPSEU_000982600 [Mayamaea pseudoterrestris]|nr:hypothetical protein MPSEU_000982600 [Mayamaea pseudoterrestris]
MNHSLAADQSTNDCLPLAMQMPQSHYPQQHHVPQIHLTKMMSATTSRRLTDRIHSSVREMVSKSRLSRLQQAEQLLLLDRSQLVTLELLGTGAFSQVHLVTTTHSHCVYAMKHVKPELLRSNNENCDASSSDSAASNSNFCLAACELAVEAHLLASFDHPHIISIRGWAANGVASFCSGCRHDSFFLLLDPLEESLDQRLSRWKEERLVLHGNGSSSSSSTSLTVSPLRPRQDGFWSRWAASSLHPQLQHVHNEQQELLEQEFIDDPELYSDKLRICAEIASALAYLHSLHVIYRDLKPNNIGFLSDGRVQLFDFGLSRELPSATSNLSDSFNMSGKVGTLRYMSPEVATHQPYAVSADVYSFAMVAYEILTLQKPFQGWTRDMHSKLVCGKHLRPDLAPLTLTTTAATRPPCSQLVRPLIEASWSAVPMQRPSMQLVYEQLSLVQRDCLIVAMSMEQQPQQRMGQPLQGLVHVSHQSPARSVSVELPPDFEVRKPPARTISAGTKTTASMSASASLAAEHFFFG